MAVIDAGISGGGVFLRTSDPRELEARKALINRLGRDDQQSLVDWFWINHSGDGRFVDVLVLAADAEVPTSFLKNLVSFAQKPKDVRRYEQEIVGFLSPKLLRAAEAARRSGGDESVAKTEYRILVDELTEFLKKLFPDAHVAMIRGALVAGGSHEGGRFSFDVEKIVHCSLMVNPMESER